MFASRLLLVVSALTLTFCEAPVAAQLAQRSDNASGMVGISSAGDRGRVIPLQNWDADVAGGIAMFKNQPSSKTQAKAATDPTTVFRPLPPCRLIDTRGFPAFLNIGGPFSPGERRSVPAGGRCGLPATFVKGISVTLITFNNTPSSGGTISLLPPGGGVNAVTDIFNPGTQWASTAYNVPTSANGTFDIVVSSANPDVIIDVNGYYQDLDSIDVGNQELDILGNSTGDLFEVTQSGTGSALSASNSSGGPALTIYQGSIRIPTIQAGTSPAFVHSSASSTCGAGSPLSYINHPMLNGDPNVLIFITPRSSTSPGPFRVEYNACGSNLWTIRDASGAAIFGDFNVLIVKT